MKLLVESNPAILFKKRQESRKVMIVPSNINEHAAPQMKRNKKSVFEHSPNKCKSRGSSVGRLHGKKHGMDCIEMEKVGILLDEVNGRCKSSFEIVNVAEGG
jgi:hypothetical protein